LLQNWRKVNEKVCIYLVKVEVETVKKSESKKSLEAILVGASAGLIVGAIIGISGAVKYLDFGSDEVFITTISVTAGILNPFENRSKFGSYILGSGTANIFYRIGYYGSRALYELLR